MSQQASSQDSIFASLFIAISEINATFFATCRDLTLRPAVVMQSIGESSSKYLNPYRFAFLILSFYTVLASLLGFDISGNAKGRSDIEPLLSEAFQFIDNAMIFLTFISLIPTAWALSKLFKSNYTRKQCYEIALYANAIYILACTLMIPAAYLLGGQEFLTIMSIPLAVILIWAYKEAFSATWLSSLWKGAISVLVNLIVFTLIITLVIFGFGIKHGYQEAHKKHLAKTIEQPIKDANTQQSPAQ